jgi:hypothetical protein
MPRLTALVCVLAVCAAACSPPPQKEIDRAQGALDAAKAAEAPRYATTEFTAASTSMQQAHDAVEQRDYRLALTKALEASEHAQQAVRQAADAKARARGDVERAMATDAASLQQLQLLIKADGPRVPAATLAAARETAASATTALQKAGALVKTDQYIEAHDAMRGQRERIAEQMRAMNEAARARPARRRS